MFALFQTGRKYTLGVHNHYKFKEFSNYSSQQQAQVKKDYYTFLIVRHPFERLLSAYRNKFSQAKADNFRKKYGGRILRAYRSERLSHQQYKSGVNVTFTEFCRFVVDLHRKWPYTENSRVINEHWNSVRNVCRPCSLR